MRREIHLVRNEAGRNTTDPKSNMSAVAECLRSWRREGYSATSSWTEVKSVLQTEAFAHWTRDVHNIVALEEALKDIAPHLRRILYGYICQGYTQSEIGEALGISQEAVRYNLKTAMDKLASLIA